MKHFILPFLLLFAAFAAKASTEKLSNNEDFITFGIAKPNK